MSQDPEWMQIYVNVVVTTLQKSSENKIINVLGGKIFPQEQALVWVLKAQLSSEEQSKGMPKRVSRGSRRQEGKAG